jgi:hypothetical protein
MRMSSADKKHLFPSLVFVQTGDAEPPDWNDIMAEVWRAQKGVKSGERVPNPVLAERERRRR